MTSTKSQLPLLLLLLSVLALTFTIEARNLIAGERQQGDGPICHGEFYLSPHPGKLAHMWTSCEVTRPEQYITYIAVLDRICPEQGGLAQIYRGGICQKSVSVNMWSPRGSALNFSVYIYATPYC